MEFKKRMTDLFAVLQNLHKANTQEPGKTLNFEEDIVYNGKNTATDFTQEFNSGGLSA